MALSFRHIRAALRHIRQGFLLDHISGAGNRAALHADYVRIAENMALQDYTPADRHSAWTVGDYRGFKYKRAARVPAPDGQSYVPGFTSYTDNLANFARALVQKMGEEAYIRASQRHSDYSDSPQSAHIFRGTVSPTNRSRKARRSDHILIAAYAGTTGGVTPAEAIAYFVDRLNAHYCKRGRAGAPNARRALYRGLSRERMPEAAINPATKSDRGIPKPGYALFWLEGSAPSNEVQPSSVLFTHQLAPMWMLDDESHMPNIWGMNSETRQPDQSDMRPMLVLSQYLHLGETKICASTGQTWWQRHMYQGAERDASRGAARRYYGAPHYVLAIHGICRADREAQAASLREVRRRNPETRALAVNLEEGALLNYSDSPLTCWPAPGWYGHNGPTIEPEARVTERGKVRGLRYLGVELEVGYPMDRDGMRLETWDKREAVRTVATLLRNFAISKSDGSIAAADGFEIVSRPAVLSQQVKLWTPFLNWAPGKVAGYRHRVCGMHIHVSKNALTPLQLGRMIVFLNSHENRDFITRIAGRGSNTYSRVAPKTLTCGLGYMKDIRNRYGERVEQRPRHEGTAEGRYSALNLETGKGTVEFRLFQSNVAKDGFLKNVEFVDALCVWAGQTGNRDLGAASFCAFADSRAKSYPHLTAWLRKSGYLADTTPKDEKVRAAHSLPAARTWLQKAAA